MRLDKTKDRSIQKILGNLFKIRYIWCNLKLAQERGLQFYQTQSHAIVLYNTLPAVCIEKAVCMKTKEELYHKICLTPRLPRVVLKANSHSGQQNQREHDARTFLACRLSTVEQQDTNRKDKVKKLIEQFESHPNKEPFLQDLSQTQRIAGFDRRPEQH